MANRQRRKLWLRLRSNRKLIRRSAHGPRDGSGASEPGRRSVGGRGVPVPESDDGILVDAENTRDI